MQAAHYIEQPLILNLFCSLHSQQPNSFQLKPDWVLQSKLATKDLVSENSLLPLVHCPIKLFLCCLCWQFCCFYLCLMTNTKMRNMKTQLGNLLLSQIGLLCQEISLALSRYMQGDGDQHKRIEEDTQINWSESVYMYKCNISFLVPCVSSSDVINSRRLIKESISVVGQ